MMGALAGDVLGSTKEGHPVKRTSFHLYHDRSRLTDDSVMTLAVAGAILEEGAGRSQAPAPETAGDSGPQVPDAPDRGPGEADYARWMRAVGRRYPRAGYGGSFRRWLSDPSRGPYNSWGNGAAMRVSPVGWAFEDQADVLTQAARTAAPTHNHPEGIKGAGAVALAVFLARQGADRETIRREIAGRFHYDLDRTVEEIRPGYRFDVSCQGSVPESIIAFLDSTGVEDAIRNAISLGGDADTQACVAGAIAEAFYGSVPHRMLTFVLTRMDGYLLGVALRFARVYLPDETRRVVEAEAAARGLRFPEGGHS